MKSFGERLSYLRNKKGLSQDELAKIFKIGKSTLGMYETNKREPKHEMTARIAEYFDVSMDWLTTGKNEKELKESSYALPEEVILNVIREAEAEFKVDLRDDPVVESAVRDLIKNLAMMKKATQKND
ncbi:helix-turn-helix domain-containing protein [Paenibacillus sp. UASWS1643]|uniref:helix-turn-helix domain-containing protein n=1 Tax=Paenibacillus sp. UASWS1643 TaxID=2580422 RepID=UPI00123BB0D5|nr:helix-turn-helix transcriptional regulator [Paenibacillus sp. UASWS1643]KAA8747146.1 helix-turn-helix transcriptional regulator [Paenibacillus sp. UASWS1643]